MKMFEKLIWQKDRVLLDELVFRLEYARNEQWKLGDNCFVFYKSKQLVEEYADLLSARERTSFQNIFEIGIWEGGSVAFWSECFQPRKLVAVDILRRSDPNYFRQFIASRGLEGRVKTYWSVDQGDSEMLRKIVRQEFDAPLDLVIDDGSHQYGPTKCTFETLFPLLRPGGLYIIEDWAWAHWEKFLAKDPKWIQRKPLADLVVQVMQLIATRPPHEKDLSPIKKMSVYHGFIVIERSGAPISEANAFRIEDQIYTRPSPSETATAPPSNA